MRVLRTMGLVGAVAISGGVYSGLEAASLGDGPTLQDDEASQIQALRQEVAQLRADNAQIEMLRHEVAQLKNDQSQDWLTDQREQEIKSLVQEVLADAQGRASLMAEGLTAGHSGSHFFLTSLDESFRMEIDGRIQVRYLMNFRDNAADGTGANSADDFESGFEIRRAKLGFEGYIASPRLGYELQLKVDRENNIIEADKIFIFYQLTDDLMIWAGEDKAPFMREELVSSKRQLAVERSVFNEQFTVDKVQGIGFVADLSQMIRVQGMVHDGFGSGKGDTDIFITQTDDFNGTGDDRETSQRYFEDGSDVAFTTRVEILLSGNWRQFKDFSSWSSDEFAVMLGGAMHYEIGETGDAFLNNNFFAWTIDGSVELNGLNFFAAMAGQHSDLDDAATVGGFDRIGFMVQGGYNFPFGEHRVEPFARFEWIDFDGTNGTNGPGRDDNLSLITLGANYYLNRHDAKFTVDVVIALDNVRDRHTGLGLLRDAEGEEGQVVVRSQFQLLF